MTFEQLEKIAAQAATMRGDYELRCLGLMVGRYHTLKFAITMAGKLGEQIDAPVTIH